MCFRKGGMPLTFLLEMPSPGSNLSHECFKKSFSEGGLYNFLNNFCNNFLNNFWRRVCRILGIIFGRIQGRIFGRNWGRRIFGEYVQKKK